MTGLVEDYSFRFAWQNKAPDEYAATRRAIVQTAAKIGKAMEKK